MRPPKHIREERKAKVATAVAAYRAMSKAERKAETSKGYRLSPDPTISHRISMHPGKMHSGNSPDSILTSKQKQAKYRLKDKELYDYDRL